MERDRETDRDGEKQREGERRGSETESQCVKHCRNMMNLTACETLCFTPTNPLPPPPSPPAPYPAIAPSLCCLTSFPLSKHPHHFPCPVPDVPQSPGKKISPEFPPLDWTFSDGVIAMAVQPTHSGSVYSCVVNKIQTDSAK